MANKYWTKLESEVGKLLKTLGQEVVVEVTEEGGRSSSGKKLPGIVTQYKGIGIRGKYDSQFITTESVIKSGDVKFTVQFDDKTFNPTDKKDQKLIFAGTVYTIINVIQIAPTDNTICWQIQTRRVN